MRPLLGVGVVAALLAVGCDARDVTAPAPSAAPQDGPRLNTAGGALGSSFLRPPPTSHPNDVAAPPFQPFSPAPAGTWIIVRTSGQVHSEFYEPCGKAATEMWPCGTGNQLSPFSATFPSTVGPVQVVLQTGQSETPVPLRGAGGGAVGLLYSSNGGVLAGRVMMPANGQAMAGHDYIPAFTFSGGYSTTAVEIPPPLEVVESGGGAGRPNIYSVAPLYGLQLINPRDPYYFQFWPAGAVTWTFIRGENVSDDPRIPGVEHIPVNDCGFQITCSYTPRGPGRMQATAWVEGRPVTVRSVIASEGEPFELKCDGASDSLRITRASNVDCRVTGTDEITGWSFRADAGGYSNPAANATPFRGAVWDGKIVLSGIVSVSATVAGREDSRSVHIRVEGRDWTGISIPRDISEQPVPPNHLPARPDSVHQLGDIHQAMSLELGRGMWEPILSGPNANLAFFTGVPAQYEAIVHVNRAALAVGSDFWNAQYTRQRSSGVVDCLQREADIVGFIPVVLRHEGIGFDPKSHAFLYVAEAERVGNPGYERAVAPTPQELADSAAIVLAAAHAAALRASAIADSAGYRPSWCRFHFNYPRR